MLSLADYLVPENKRGKKLKGTDLHLPPDVMGVSFYEKAGQRKTRVVFYYTGGYIATEVAYHSGTLLHRAAQQNLIRNPDIIIPEDLELKLTA